MPELAQKAKFFVDTVHNPQSMRDAMPSRTPGILQAVNAWMYLVSVWTST